MSAYPQVALFDVSSAIQVSSHFLNGIQGSLRSSELTRLKFEVSSLRSETYSAVNTPKDQIFNGLEEYLKLVFLCTVAPVEAIATQLTFVLIADLGARSQNGTTFADYRNRNGELVKGKFLWEEAENYYGLTGRPELSKFYKEVAQLHQNLSYSESPMPKVSSVGVPSTKSDGKTVGDYCRPECRNELKSVASQTIEFVRRINKLLQKIESIVLSWRSVLGIVEDSKPKFWLGENAKSFDLAMVELKRLFSLKEPQITSPIRELRLQLARRVDQIPEEEITKLIGSIEGLQEQIALIHIPVGEALSDLDKFLLLSHRGSLKEQLDLKCARLLEIRQNLSLIHKRIEGDFDNLDELLGTFKSVITRTRSRFGINQVPKFFGDTTVSSPGIIFERAGRAGVEIAVNSDMVDTGDIEKTIALFESSGKEAIGLGVVKSGEVIVSAAQAGEVSKAFLTSMKVAPLIGVLVQIHIKGSDMEKERSLIIEALRESLPIPSDVFKNFVEKEIEKVFDQNRLKEIFQTIFLGAVVFATGGALGVVLAGAFALAEKIEESREYKELVADIQTAVARGFKEWEKSLAKGSS